MSWRRFVARALGAVGRARRDDELRHELEAHLALLEDEYRRDGLTEQAARERARRTFGNVTLARERSEDTWTFGAADSIVKDLRYAARMIRRAPGISLVVVSIVAIGIAASTALYSLVDACVLHNNTYPVVDRWVIVHARSADQRTFSNFSSVPEIEDVSRLTDVFEAVGAIIGSGFTTTNGEFPEHVDATRVTANGIRMTGVPPLLGRSFTDEEDRPGGPAVAVLSYEFWKRQYSEDRSVLGRTITLDGRPYTIIGVMPPHYGLWGGELWVPMQLDRSQTDRGARQYWIEAVLRKGVAPAAANARLAALSAQFARDYRLTNPEYEQQRLEVWNINEAVTGGIKPAFVALSAAVALLLILACVNIATLLLARASSRSRELAIRAAIGAGRARLIRQLLTESLLLSCAGGAAGIVLAVWTLPYLVHLIPPTVLTADPEVIHVNTPALLVAMAATLVTGVLFGAVPALTTTDANLAGSLRTRAAAGGPGSGGRTERRLLIAELALVLVVLSSAALTLVSYERMREIDLGFAPDHLLTFSITLPMNVYQAPGKIATFHTEVLSRLRAIPGVIGAAETSLLPLRYRTVDVTSYDLEIEGRPPQAGAPTDNASFRLVGPGYVEVLRTPLLEGRTFTDADVAGQPAVAMVNETMARRYWPSGAVGRRFTLRRRVGRVDPLRMPERAAEIPITVVGVIHDSRQTRVLETPIRQEFYLPIGQRLADARIASVVLRTSEDPSNAAASVRKAIKAVDPGQPISDFATMEESLADSFGPHRLTLLLLTFFAGVSLVLAAVGLYAVANHGVARRTREIGIRMALGADASQVVGLFALEGIRVTALGVLAGVLASLAATRLVSAQLYGVTPTDPIVLASVATLLGFIAITAALVPARRAVKVDPAIALRPD
jgi:putative ABC transport system permease protein